MKYIRLTLCAALTIAMLSCNKDMPHNGPGEQDAPATLFDFSTSQELTVKVIYPIARPTYLEIYTENPLRVDHLKNYVPVEGLLPVAKGYTDARGELCLPLRLAAHDSEIYVYSPGAAAPLLLGRRLTGAGEVTLTTADRVAAGARATNAIAETNAYWKNWKSFTFSFLRHPEWTWDADGKPNNLLEPRKVYDEKMLEIIDNTIPKGEALEIIFCQLHEIVISEAAHLDIHFVSRSSARRNTLAYYTYTGTAPSREEINRSLTVLFPNVSEEVLEPGDGVRMAYYDGANWSDVFPAGSKIGFVLLVDAWDNGNVAASGQALYSDKAHNRYDIPNLCMMADIPHMAAFDARDNFIISFQDLPYYDAPGSPYPGDFSDNIFVLDADPVTALPEVNEGIEDPDMPKGSEVAVKGVLAFEDLWPYKGDYDMNDVVVSYDSKAYLDQNYDIDGIVTKWTFCNNGGQYVNGFGAAYDIPRSIIKSIRLEATNGVAVAGIEEQAGEHLQVMLFHNAADVPSGTVFTVTIKFHKGALDYFRGMKKATAPFNPFITVRSKNDAIDAIPRKEVHLTNYKPTPLARTFDGPYGDDLSDPAKGFYYTAATGYPFAIDLSGVDSFDCPGERECIGDAYPRFKTWAESKGTQDKDWYKK